MRAVAAMNVLLAFCACAALALAAAGLYQLQSRLEQWDYERHSQD